jgi:hypothetical protein
VIVRVLVLRWALELVLVLVLELGLMQVPVLE